MSMHLIGDVAQELADHLDDLRDMGEGVAAYSQEEGQGQHKVTNVTDAEDGPHGSASFMATVGGKRLRVTVQEVDQ